jgi:AcrR family transcriptional regulator
LSNSLWSGNRPKTELEAKTRLCQAALDCIKRLGFDKTSMSDIAQEAGISRPTLYKHYKNKLDIFFAGIDWVAFSFTQSVVKHASQFHSFEERVTETIIYVVSELPKHPYLCLVLNNECAAALKERAFSDEETRIFSEMTAAPLVELRPDLKDEGVEISELMSRFAISMILFPGKYSNDLNALRQLIEKRILPGLV